MDEKRCKELAEAMDGMDSADMEFILWYILPDIIKMIKEEEKIPEHAEPRQVMAAQLAREERISLERLREIIAFDLW